MPYPKPVPDPDDLSAEFWASARRHVLAIQRCTHCGHFEHPPVGVCQGCRHSSPSFRFEAVSGKGTITSWTVMRDSFIPAFKGDVPFVVGLVELVEQKGLRLIARLLDGADATYRLGMPVEVVFEDITDEATLPQFRIARRKP